MYSTSAIAGNWSVVVPNVRYILMLFGAGRGNVCDVHQMSSGHSAKLKFFMQLPVHGDRLLNICGTRAQLPERAARRRRNHFPDYFRFRAGQKLLHFGERIMRFRENFNTLRCVWSADGTLSLWRLCFVSGCEMLGGGRDNCSALCPTTSHAGKLLPQENTNFPNCPTPIKSGRKTWWNQTVLPLCTCLGNRKFLDFVQRSTTCTRRQEYLNCRF
jgi:hypothetical protein